MAIYAIGDVQGCYDQLRRLLDEIRFDPDSDTLWLAGDIVNRGPKSLKTLRFIRSLGDAAIMVLGNHDLHLLALSTDTMRLGKRFETLEKVLNAPDVGELIHWLRHRPLAHYNKKHDTLLVHAGVHPQWTVKKTLALANEVETALQGKKFETLMSKMYGNTPRHWSEELRGYRRLRFIINTLTRMRLMTTSQGLNFSHTGSPWRARKDLKPWFRFPHRQSGKTRIAFGHWSILGLIVMPDLLSLDTGCVWGRHLTAVRIDKKAPRVFQVAGQ